VELYSAGAQLYYRADCEQTPGLDGGHPSAVWTFTFRNAMQRQGQSLSVIASNPTNAADQFSQSLVLGSATGTPTGSVTATSLDLSCDSLSVPTLILQTSPTQRFNLRVVHPGVSGIRD
jgi:hypothetical protein